MNCKKWSVGAIITNPKKTLFYLQQKDNTYFVKQNRLKYCFFGGGVKEQESELDALKRELSEELDNRYTELIIKTLKRQFDRYFTNNQNISYRFTLYESIIPEKDLLELSKLQPNEGKRGILISREQLKEIPIFLDLEDTRDRYLKGLGE